MLLLDYHIMRQGPGEKLAFWLSMANFAAPFLGVAETGQKCPIIGLFDFSACSAVSMRVYSVLLLNVWGNERHDDRYILVFER